jgi:hypothetical protein
VKAGAEAVLEVRAEPAAGEILNPRAPLIARFVEVAGQVQVPRDWVRRHALPPDGPLSLRFTAGPGASQLFVEVDFWRCRADRKGLCFASARRYKLVVDGRTDEKNTVVRLTARP